MYSREDVVKNLLGKKGTDPFSTGGVSSFGILNLEIRAVQGYFHR